MSEVTPAGYTLMGTSGRFSALAEEDFERIREIVREEIRSLDADWLFPEDYLPMLARLEAGAEVLLDGRTAEVSERIIRKRAAQAAGGPSPEDPPTLPVRDLPQSSEDGRR